MLQWQILMMSLVSESLHIFFSWEQKEPRSSLSIKISTGLALNLFFKLSWLAWTIHKSWKKASGLCVDEIQFVKSKVELRVEGDDSWLHQFLVSGKLTSNKLETSLNFNQDWNKFKKISYFECVLCMCTVTVYRTKN